MVERSGWRDGIMKIKHTDGHNCSGIIIVDDNSGCKFKNCFRPAYPMTDIRYVMSANDLITDH